MPELPPIRIEWVYEERHFVNEHGAPGEWVNPRLIGLAFWKNGKKLFIGCEPQALYLTPFQVDSRIALMYQMAQMMGANSSCPN